MEPIWKLLRSRQNDEEWNPLLRGSLRSAFANRQYPQLRVKAAGWSLHDRCLFCLNLQIERAIGDTAAAARRKAHEEKGKSGCARVDLLAGTDAATVEAAPHGSTNHRIYVCPRLEPSRAKYASIEVIAAGKANPGTLDFDRAMKQRPRKPTTEPTRGGHLPMPCGA